MLSVNCGGTAPSSFLLFLIIISNKKICFFFGVIYQFLEALDLIGYLYKKVSILANDVYNLLTRVVWQDLVLTYISSCLCGYDMIWWGLQEY